jgi:hypothetical protein
MYIYMYIYICIKVVEAYRIESIRRTFPEKKRVHHTHNIYIYYIYIQTYMHHIKLIYLEASHHGCAHFPWEVSACLLARSNREIFAEASGTREKK